MKFNCTEEAIKEALKDDKTILETAKDIGDDIAANETDVTAFIENLGFALISTDVDMRVKATRLLSETLANLPIAYLNEVQLNFISTFYSDRLKDHHSVMPGVFIGILAISKMKNLPSGSATRILQSFFHNTSCQSQLREDRQNIFKFLQIFSDRQQDELKAMGADFVYGVINSIDGERDPRILIQIFSFIPTFLQIYPLKHLVEEMFEVFACYFPVDFHPVPNDPEAVSREFLAENLSNCLCASPEFAEHCIALLLDKMDSQLNVAKLDSLDLLSKAAENFKINDLETHFESIWTAIKIETLPGTDKDITAAALKSLKTIIKSVSVDENICKNLLTQIFETILSPLSDVNARLFTPATAIALSCSMASKTSAFVVAEKLLPSFLTQIRLNHDLSEQKSTLLELVTQLIVNCDEAKLDKELIENIQDEAIQCLGEVEAEKSASSTNDDLLLVSLTSLTKIVSLVTAKNRISIYKCIERDLYDEKSNENIHRQFRLTLITFAKHYPVEVMANVVENILNKTYAANDSLTIANKIFDSVRELAFISEFTEHILKFIFKNIFYAENVNVQLIALNNLRQLLELDTATNSITLDLYKNYDIVEKFVKFARLTLNSDLLYQLSIILRLIVKSLDTAEQHKLITLYLPKMNLQKVSDLYLTAGILGFLEKAVDLEDHFDNIVAELMQLALNSDDEKMVEISKQLLSSLFNKMSDSDNQRSILHRTVVFLKSEIEKHNKKAIAILAWITKGLLTRGHPEAAELVEDLTQLLEHSTLANSAALVFDILSVEYPALHLPIVKHLFKQKLFQIVLKKIWRKLNDYSEHHLTAMAFVMKETPHSVLKMNIEKIGPILFKSLELTTTTPVLNALTIINRFIKEQNEYFRDHLQHLVPSFIELCKFQDSMKIRMSAIDCILSMIIYPIFVLIPYKTDILQGLVVPLDDKKRLVRNEAVLARNQWCLVGSADGKK